MKILTTKETGVNCLKFLIFGDSGSGKTTLAGTITEPTLVISAEAGLLALRDKSIDVIDISVDDEGNVLPKEKRIERLIQAYNYLLLEETKKAYKWVFIDSLTEISHAMIDMLLKEYPERKDSLVMYGENSKKMKGLIKAFRDLPYYNVVFTALSSVEKDENNQRYVGISVVGSLADKIPAFFDEVLYLQCDKDPDTGEARRVLVTEKSEKLMAKDRSGRLDKFEAPDLGLISKKIKDGKVEKNKAVAVSSQ